MELDFIENRRRNQLPRFFADANFMCAHRILILRLYNCYLRIHDKFFGYYFR